MFDFDLNFTTQSAICGLVKKMKSKQKNFFNITKETKQLSNLIKTPPQKDECYKMLSVGGEYVNGVWQPNKQGLGMGHVFDELNKIYGKDFIKY